MIPWYHDYLADTLRMLDEGAGSLELSRSAALRKITRDRDDVEAALLNDGLDRFILLRHRGVSEV